MASRRITMHAEVDGRLQAYDLVVCGRTPVAELLPELVDVTVGDLDQGIRWRLARSAGAPLDESMSLLDNGVHDGDVTVLHADDDAARGPVAVAPLRAIADTSAGREPRLGVLDLCWVWLAMTVAAVLSTTSVLADALALACCAAATCWRAASVRNPALAVTGVTIAGVAAGAALPSTLGAPHVLLGAAVVFAASAALSRLVAQARTALTAVGAAAATIAAVAAFAPPAPTAGVALAVGGLALLVAAPRCGALMAGVQPGHAVDPPPDLAARAEAAHSTLTGLVCGSAVTVAAGAGVLAWAVPQSDVARPAAIAFLAVTAVLLLVRLRTHADAPRRTALAAAGMANLTALLVVVAAAYPAWIGWVAVGLVTSLAGAGVTRPKPAVTRALDALDHLCGALLVPLACWVLGLYALARNWVFT